MQSAIKSFKINGLFGTKNVHIPFDESVKVLIGENGLGKTQTLNLLYYTLMCNFYKLNQFRFDSIELVLSNQTITIEKGKLEKSVNEIYKRPIVKDVISKIGVGEFERLINKYKKAKKHWDLEEYIEQKYKYNRRNGIPPHMIFRAVEEVVEMEKHRKDKYLTNLNKQIQDNLDNSELIYFPTYRRVEESSHNLGFEEDNDMENEDTKIQFGMEDVSRRFRAIENQIDNLLKNGINDMSSEILNQVIDEDIEEEDSFLADISENDIEILFARVGVKIAEVKKQRIKDLLLSKELKTKDGSLRFMLKKLIEIYAKQKDIDTAIKKFKNVCNKYLIEKVVHYDESNIKIFIKSTITGENIALTNLSSGEKQIMAIFAKTYLSRKTYLSEQPTFTILFDEPELSLSIFWQKTLLPDIINSGSINLLVAATHSPFIYKEEPLKSNTVSLSAYVEPIKKEEV